MPNNREVEATFRLHNIAKKISIFDAPLHEMLRKKSKSYPNKTAIAFSGTEISYGELDLLSDHFASALSDMGIEKGDRVALLLPNIPQFAIAFYGIMKTGAIATAISPLHREREVQQQLSDSGAETIVALESLQSILKAVWTNTKLKRAIVTHIDEFSTNHSPLAQGESLEENCYPFPQLLFERSLPLPKVDVDPTEDLAVLQYTGGTTGTPKGAMLTHKNLVSNALAFAAWIRGVESEETFLTVLPLFHIYGLTTSLTVPISLAAKMVFLPKFDSRTVLENIQRHQVTVFCGVPTMYSAMLSNPEIPNFNLSSLRACISGASPLPPQVQKKFIELSGCPLAEGYGLTEASPVTHCNPITRTMEDVRFGSIGLPLPDTKAEIVDAETGEKILRNDETGELAVKGPQVMKG
jgi:long-chain acyl-CoA synthetase